MNIKVSVIIPVYNCERYIEECIQSLLGQTLKECEFIFINDGSTDNTYNLLTKYEKLDKRIKLINQSNQGVSAARNNGLAVVSGEYIGFVDGDDTVDKDYFEKLYFTAIKNNIDIVGCGWKEKNKEITRNIDIPFTKNKVLNKEFIKEIIYPALVESDSLNAIWNKIYKSKLILSNNISFPIGIALGEDGRFNVSAFTYANNAFFLDYYGYYYRDVEGSATRNILEKDYFIRSLQVYEESIEQYDKWDIDSDVVKKFKVKKFINNVLSYTYLYFNATNDLSFKQRYKYVKNMVNNETVRNTFKNYNNEIYEGKGRYDSFVLKCIEKRLTIGIYISTLYSRLRNS